MALVASIRGRTEGRDLPPAALAGAIAGAMIVSVFVAACRVVEAPFAAVPGASWAIAAIVWAVVGVVVANVSLLVVPPESPSEGQAR
jgi:membrane protein implicated in regulation of membrane protease activity